MTDKRNEIRAAIFASKKRKSKIVNVFGVDVEIRQPSMGQILDLQAIPTTKDRIVQALMNYCYVPGTNDKIFEPADKDGILNQSYGAEFVQIQEAINELTDLDIEAEQGNSSGAQPEEIS